MASDAEDDPLDVSGDTPADKTPDKKPADKPDDDPLGGLDLDFDEPDPNDAKAKRAADAMKEMQDKHVQVVGSGDAAISFLPTMSKTNVQKIINSVWVAQSAAELKGYDKQKDPIKYFKFFNSVLKAIGWTVGCEKWQKFTQSSNDQYMGAAVVDILIDTMEATASGGVSALGTGLSTLKSLKAQSHNGFIPMFKGQSEGMSDNSFQIGTCSQDTFEIASMSTSVFTYNTHSDQGGFLFWKWKTNSVVIEFQAVKMGLNDEVYDDAHDRIVKIRRAMANDLMNDALKPWQIKSTDVAKAMNTPDPDLDGAMGVHYKKKKLGAMFEDNNLLDAINYFSPGASHEELARGESMLHEARAERHHQDIAALHAEIGSQPDQAVFEREMESFLGFVEHSRVTQSNGWSKDSCSEFVQKIRGPHGGMHYYNEAQQQALGIHDGPPSWATPEANEERPRKIILRTDYKSQMSLAPNTKPLFLKNGVFKQGTLKFTEIGSGGKFGAQRWMQVSVEDAVLAGGVKLTEPIVREYNMGDPKANPQDKQKYTRKNGASEFYTNFASLVGKQLTRGHGAEDDALVWPDHLVSKAWHTEGHMGLDDEGNPRVGAAFDDSDDEGHDSDDEGHGHDERPSRKRPRSPCNDGDRSRSRSLPAADTTGRSSGRPGSSADGGMMLTALAGDKKKGDDYLNNIVQDIAGAAEEFVVQYTKPKAGEQPWIKQCKSLDELAREAPAFADCARKLKDLAFVDPRHHGDTIDAKRKILAVIERDNSIPDTNAQIHGHFKEQMVLNFGGCGYFCQRVFIKKETQWMGQLNEKMRVATDDARKLVDRHYVVDEGVERVQTPAQKATGTTLMHDLKSHWLPEVLKFIQMMEEAAQNTKPRAQRQQQLMSSASAPSVDFSRQQGRPSTGQQRQVLGQAIYDQLQKLNITPLTQQVCGDLTDTMLNTWDNKMLVDLLGNPSAFQQAAKAAYVAKRDQVRQSILMAKGKGVAKGKGNAKGKGEPVMIAMMPVMKTLIPVPFNADELPGDADTSTMEVVDAVLVRQLPDGRYVLDFQGHQLVRHAHHVRGLAQQPQVAHNTDADNGDVIM